MIPAPDRPHFPAADDVSGAVASPVGSFCPFPPKPAVAPSAPDEIAWAWSRPRVRAMNEASHVCINVTIRRERTDIPLHVGVGPMKRKASRTARWQVNPDVVPMKFEGCDTLAAESQRSSAGIRAG